MRVISASGRQADEIISGIVAGFSKANIPYLCMSTSGCKDSCCRRPLAGSAIDGCGEAVGECAEVLLASTDHIPFLSGFDEGIAILSPDSKGEGCQFRKRGFVISSQDTQIPSILRKYPGISCGMNAKDTVTFSSLRADRGMICLQRKLITFEGRVIEPQEFPTIGEGFGTLAVFTALLLCDVIK